MRPDLGRSILTVHLEDALEKGICPICFLCNEAEYRYLDLLLYESINDEGIRELLRKSRGFCTYHTYRMIEVGGYGIHAKLALLYRDLLNTAGREVEGIDPRAGRVTTPAVDCPTCRIIQDTVDRFAPVLARRLKDGHFREHYKRATGLCMRHFYPVFAASNGHTRTFLKEDQLERLRGLSAELAEFVRKGIERTEPFGEERDSWIRGVQLYAGRLKR